jgi:hypothetical protein
MSQLERPNPPQETTTARRAVQTGVRLLLAAGVLFVGYWTITRFTSLLHDREPAAVPTPSAAAGPTTTEPARLDSLALSQLGGSWEFYSAGWSLEVGTAQSASPPGFWEQGEDSAVELPTYIDAVEASLLQLFPAQSSDGSVAKLNASGLRAEAITRDTPRRRRIVSARGVLQTGNGQWMTIAAVRTHQPQSALPRFSLIHPEIPNVENLAFRRGPDGDAIGQFAKSSLTIDSLLEMWRLTGHTITLNDGYGVANTREGTYLGMNSRTMHIILWQPEGRSETTILVLDPSVAEAVPK